MTVTKEAESGRLPTPEEIIKGFEAGSQLLRLPDTILTPETLSQLSEGYGRFNRFQSHVWIAPDLASCLAQTGQNEYSEVFIVSGGVASGKTELVRRTGRPRVRTVTTRPPREREIDGIDYDFFARDDFLSYASEGHFAETVPLGRFLYGTPWENIAEAMNTQGAACILCVVEQEGVKNLQPQIFERYGKYPVRVTVIPELSPRDYLTQIVGSRARKLDDLAQIFWRLSLTLDNLVKSPEQTDIFVGNSFQPGGLDESVEALNGAISYCLDAISKVTLK